LTYRTMFPVVLGLVVLISAACSGGDADPDESRDASRIAAPVSELTPEPSPQPAAEPVPTPENTPTPLPRPDDLKVETATPEATSAANPRAETDRDTLEEMAFLFHTQRGWKTDFSKLAVPISEIIPGGPPRDGIPPIDEPKLVPVLDAPARN